MIWPVCFTTFLLLFPVHESTAQVPSGLDMRLLKDLTTKQDRNQAISPFLMSTLMSQVWLAGRGTTRKEVASVLGITRFSDPVAILLGYRSAIASLSTNSSSVTTAVFNRIYARDQFNVSEFYSRVLDYIYGAGVQKFSSASQVTNDINTAVANVTRGRIPKLIQGELGRGTVLVLVSALYFKGAWVYRFDNTVTAPFLTAEGEVQAPLMKVRGNLLHGHFPDYQAVSLPYTDNAYSLILLVPNHRNITAVAKLQRTLDTIDMTQLYSSLRPTVVNVTMPRFKIETRYELIPSMKRLGMKAAFGAGADFKYLGEDAAGVFISNIIHQVFIEVNEEGTEAAAAGAVVFFRSTPPHVNADRPFFAILYNNVHRISLFSALVAKP